jgi:hypothetical protein
MPESSRLALDAVGAVGQRPAEPVSGTRVARPSHLITVPVGHARILPCR